MLTTMKILIMKLFDGYLEVFLDSYIDMVYFKIRSSVYKNYFATASSISFLILACSLTMANLSGVNPK